VEPLRKYSKIASKVSRAERENSLHSSFEKVRFKNFHDLDRLEKDVNNSQYSVEDISVEPKNSKTLL